MSASITPSSVSPQIITGTDQDDFLTGTSGSDQINGLAGNDILSAGFNDPALNSHDILDGGDGNDGLDAERGSSTELFGGAGNDHIHLMTNHTGATGNIHVDGGAGDDHIYLGDPAWAGMSVSGDLVEAAGGAGNDIIEGGMNAETVLFNRGDGQDRINLHDASNEIDLAEQDAIRFGEGISLSDLRAEHWVDPEFPHDPAGIRLQILENGVETGDSIIMASNLTERLLFADGSEARLSDLPVAVPVTEVRGTEGDDMLSGESQRSDHLLGLAGNDVLSAGTTDVTGMTHDILDGGDGDDVLNAERGSSTELLGGAGKDRITLMDNYLGGKGTVVVDGGADDDHIDLSLNGRVTSGDLVEVTGGTGNDSILGSWHAETFVFNRGDGMDWIDLAGHSAEVDATEQDAIRFGEGVSAADLRLERVSGYDETHLVVLSDGQDIGDRIIMDRTLTEKLVFADGSMRALSTLPLDLLGSEQDDVLALEEGARGLSGGGGNDHLLTGPALALALPQGDVRLDGGAGDDQLTLDIPVQMGDVQLGNISLEGGAGDDQLTIDAGMHLGGGSVDKITLDGGAGDDLISSNNLVDNVVFIGGKGNDRLIGYEAADRYLFERGDGQDEIRDHGNSVANADIEFQDSIVFGDGITLADIRLTASDHHITSLALQVLENGEQTGDQLTLEYALQGDFNIETLTFAGGVDVALATLNIHHDGTQGDDMLTSVYGRTSIFNAGAGDDLLQLNAGQDIVQFGYGDGLDRVEGLSFSDNDRLVLGEGIEMEDLYVTTAYPSRDSTLYLLDDGVATGDSVTFAALPAKYSTPDNIELASGEVVSLLDVWNQSLAMDSPLLG
ncbi:MAG: hypothetical protein OIF57_09555 [Marinobacterium sp.]|nr:hypothetical protein [Marinobacterium sp.]